MRNFWSYVYFYPSCENLVKLMLWFELAFAAKLRVNVFSWSKESHLMIAE